MRKFSLIAVTACVFAFAGCDKPPATPPNGGGSTRPSAGSSEKPVAEEPSHAGHGGEIIELGTTKVGDLSVRASRDKGEIKAGGDAPIDVWLSTADDKPATVTAVRFWIGCEDAKSSVKAKGDIEDPKQPNHWHAHAEVPNPIPDGAKLWVEVEATDGTRSSGSFELGA